MPTADDSTLILLRLVAAVIDIAVQAGLVAGIMAVSNGDTAPAIVALTLPLVYSLFAICFAASPALWLLRLRITTSNRQPTGLWRRILRALILKAGYILLVIAIAMDQTDFGTPLVNLVLTSALILMAALFLSSEQCIELGEPPFYDAWLKTTVIRRRSLATVSSGFAVIMPGSQ